MRKKGIILLLVLIAISVVFGYFTRDWRIERMLENIGQSIVGAKVEIDGFHFSLFKMECSWKRIQVTDRNDPWFNIFETGKASFDLETKPLFWRRIIIKEMILENVRSGTPRKTDGSLPHRKRPSPEKESPGFADKVKTAIEKQLAEVPVFDLSGLGKKLKIDSLVDVENLLTVRGYNQLHQFTDSSFQHWQRELKPQIYLERANQIEQQLKTLKPDQIKDIPGLTNALNKVNDLQKNINELRNEVQTKHGALSQTFDTIHAGVQAVRNHLDDDINRVKQLARLTELDVKDVSLLLFGAPLVQKTDQVLSHIAAVRKHIPTLKKLKGQEKAKSPPRLKGQDIRFPFHYRYPRFLLRTANLSAATAAGDTGRAYFIRGALTGLTNQPHIFGSPTQLQ
ncbi:MAG: TIGR03545 family protein, partial [bacterium]|nr:TIGR03545 family protein [bacterium]